MFPDEKYTIDLSTPYVWLQFMSSEILSSRSDRNIIAQGWANLVPIALPQLF